MTGRSSLPPHCHAFAALSVSVTGIEAMFGADAAVGWLISGGYIMPVIWDIVLAVIWIAIAFWPARVAGRKGHSFIGYFIFSLFFFPAALIVACLVPNRGRVQPI